MVLKLCSLLYECHFYPGNPLAIIDADEEIFNKEHELEVPVRLNNKLLHC